MKKNMVKTIVALAALSFVFAACGGKKPAPAPEVEEAPAMDSAAVDGKALYTGKGGCAVCHGETGHGDGPGGATQPPARNFTDAKWKNGDDLATVVSTIKAGVPGTAMTGYGSMLSDAEIEALAKYVRELGGKQ